MRHKNEDLLVSSSLGNGLWKVQAYKASFCYSGGMIDELKQTVQHHAQCGYIYHALHGQWCSGTNVCNYTTHLNEIQLGKLLITEGLVENKKVLCPRN